MRADLQLLADGLAFPEGPVVLPDGSVAVVEMAADLVTVVSPDGSRSSVPCGPGPNGMAVTPEGDLLVCLNGGLDFEVHDAGLRPGTATHPEARGGIALLRRPTGHLAPVVPWGRGSVVSAPNDLVVPVSGPSAGDGFWFTDLGRRFARHQEHGGIYWAHLDGALAEAAYPRFGRPNGIGLTADGCTLYVTESQSAQLWAWEVLGPGRLGEGRLLHAFPHPCRLDGLAVTESGCIVVATLVTGQLTALSPDGAVLGRLDVSDPYPTNVVVDPAHDGHLLVTLGSTGRLVRLRWQP